MPTVVYQEDGSTIQVTLRASESAAIADFYNNPGSVTLHHIPSGTRYNVSVFEVPAETPDTERDVYRAERGAADLLVGGYRVEGSLTDTAGNRTVIGAVETLRVGDALSSIEFELLERRIKRWFAVFIEDETQTFYASDETQTYTVEVD